MDPLIETLRAKIRQRPSRLLIVGRFRHESEAANGGLRPWLDAETTVRWDSLPEAGSPTTESDAFDVIVWRLPRLWDDASLGQAREWLSDRGRLWIAAPRSVRRPLVLALSRLGFAILDEHSTGADDDALRLITVRRDSFVVRGYRAGDETAILNLFTPSFHVERSLDHWRWKYLANPWGKAMITIATTSEGELAAHYAGYPVPFVDARVAWQPMTAVQVGDTMTDPRFRARGKGFSSLLGRCFRHHFASYCDDQVAFNYGFNTGNIRRFNFRFIGGQLAELVGYWQRHVELPEPSRGLMRYRTSRVNRFDARYDRLVRRAAPFYGVLVHRDAAWLRWRYSECPDDPPFFAIEARRLGRLVGYGVFRRRGDRLLWVDALFDPRHLAAAADILHGALASPEAAGITGLSAWFSTHPEPWTNTLVGLGFERLPEPNDLGLIFLGFLRPDADELLARAYYTMGDSDLA